MASFSLFEVSNTSLSAINKKGFLAGGPFCLFKVSGIRMRPRSTKCDQRRITRVPSVSEKIVDIKNDRWRKHCRGLYQLPGAAWASSSPGTGASSHDGGC